jgi:hypothetical protein
MMHRGTSDMVMPVEITVEWLVRYIPGQPDRTFDTLEEAQAGQREHTGAIRWRYVSEWQVFDGA